MSDLKLFADHTDKKEYRVHPGWDWLMGYMVQNYLRIVDTNEPLKLEGISMYPCWEEEHFNRRAGAQSEAAKDVHQSDRWLLGTGTTIEMGRRGITMKLLRNF